MSQSRISTDNEISLRLALNYLDQGITVMNKELQLIAWNNRFLELLDFPESLVTTNIALETLFRFNCERGEYGDGDIEPMVRERILLAKKFEPHCFDRQRPNGTILEVKGNPIDNGNGFVTVYTDVTDQRKAQMRLTNKVARRSNALKRETRAHRNAIVVLQESERCIRSITTSHEKESHSDTDIARVLAQSEAVLHQADESNGRPTRYSFDHWQLDLGNRQLLQKK